MKKTFIPATLVITAASLLVAGTFVNRVAAADDNRDHSGAGSRLSDRLVSDAGNADQVLAPVSGCNSLWSSMSTNYPRIHFRAN